MTDDSIRRAVASSGATTNEAILGLGSNIGDKVGNIDRAIEMLADGEDVRVVSQSGKWRTAPWGDTDQDWFVNACIAVATTLEPRALLARCSAVEDRMGRVRTRHWGPRIVDVDILIYGSRDISLPDLVVPHPRITERAFVLAPLAEIAPDLEIGGRRVADWLEAVDCAGVERIG